MLRSQCRPLRLLPLIGLLAFQGCAPSYGPQGQSQGQSRQSQTQTNPIAVVGDSDDHRGFVLRGNLARIYLANGIQVIAPPQKDLVELYGDINSCRYGGGLGDTNAYLACLHNAHDVLQFPNGKILAWAKEDVPWYQGTDEPPPPNSSPYYSLPSPEEPQYNAPSTPSPQNEGVRPLTDGEKVQIAEDSFHTINDIYNSCGGKEHPYRCATIHGVFGMRREEKMAICRHPDILNMQPIAQIPKLFRDTFLTILHCA